MGSALLKHCKDCGASVFGSAQRRFCDQCRKARVAAHGRAHRKRKSDKLAEQRRLNPTVPCVDCGAEVKLGWRASGPQRHVCQACKKVRKSARYYRGAERFKAKQSAYYKARRDAINAEKRERLATDPAYRAKQRKWTIASQPRTRERLRERRKTDPQWRLAQNIRAAIWRGLAAGQKHGRTFDVLGYTIHALRAHLERCFSPGMSWENYGEWHVDHVIPLVAFNYQSTADIDFRRAWSLENLAPLWKAENQKKRSKLGAPFQPSLLIAEPHHHG